MKQSATTIQTDSIVIGQMRFSRNAITNEQFASTCNDNDLLQAAVEGGYSIVNLFNPDIPLIRLKGGKLEVRSGYEEHPAVGVTWHGAELCAALMGGRLPTVPEWELAATCGDGRTYPWGEDDPTPAHANFDENVGATRRIGSYPPNPLGLFDMAGNVGEWCRPDGEDSTSHSVRVLDVDREYPVKGGAWNKPPALLPCSATRFKWGRIGTVGIGFRIVFDETTTVETSEVLLT